MNNWKWHVYILECKDGLYYTGMTSDLHKRIDQHESGLGSKFTARHGFKELRYHEQFTVLEEARMREIQLKGWNRSKKESLWSDEESQDSNDSRLEQSSRSNNKGRKISLIAHNIRSTHNVGAFFRTCDGLGIDEIIFSGYTPYPTLDDDTRLPHFADKLTRQIHKTALGAETSVAFSRYETLEEALSSLNESTKIVALEQAKNSLAPSEVKTELISDQNVALVIGNEIHGVDEATLNSADYIMEIPMHGTKESLNVSVATGIALYELSKQ
jgi:tRNA G18 (ribose-2'-O)-methylase SpoU